MPKKRRKPRRPHRPRHASPRRPSAPPPGEAGEPDLMATVREMLEEDHPWGLLGYVSAILEAVEAKERNPFAPSGAEPSGPSLAELVESFVGVDLPETTAVLIVLAELVPDEVLARRLRREVAARGHQLPGWLTGLAPLRVGAAVETAHVLGDGDNVMVEVRTGAGDVLTALVYIDHNLGTLVKDAFVVPATLDELRARFVEASGNDPDVAVRELDLADVRARVDEAIELWAMTYPPPESETWPACRPLVAWIARHLPVGGSGYERPEWSEADREALTERFFASPHGQGHDAEDRDLFETLLWFGCDYGPGDPLRWSPVAVEILLSDWLPRKVVADAAFLARAPALLRSLIRFSHAERGIREALTEETLAAVDAWEPEYQEAIRSPRPQGPAALLAAMGMDLDLLGDEDDDFPFDTAELLLDSLARDVGGEEALAALDDVPLPDEPFDWSVVPDDVRDRVGEVLGHLDRCCDALLDVEARTACRRLLADVVAGDAGVLRRRGRTDTAAAAIAWAVAKANGMLSPGGLTAKELVACFGVSGSVSSRASTLTKAANLGAFDAYGPGLGSTRYLTSACRREIITTRDRWQAERG